MKREWIRFELMEEKPKTKIWKVIETREGLSIGEIKWQGSWRQYVFFPYEDTIYSWDCLEGISNFIKEKMEEHKKVA